MNPAFLDKSARRPFAEALVAVQRIHPLVDCITNIVTVNDVANGLLAIDARPVMASAPEEINILLPVPTPYSVTSAPLPVTNVKPCSRAVPTRIIWASRS